MDPVASFDLSTVDLLTADNAMTPKAIPALVAQVLLAAK
jgi:hypothetical protein